MPEPLNVVPADLHTSADRLDGHRSELLAQHGTANANIEDSLSGWVGASGAAMQSKLADLTAADAHISGELRRHDDLSRHAAWNFETADDEEMATFIRLGNRL